ncbi:restriction endonuclease [Bacillus paramycoides]|uniref:restriction endonuclease n=1 Tax=Bacillus paramycoides TaxID=2026194 RepID=UPI003CFBF7FE
MMWAILLLVDIFLIGTIFKAPEVSREEIQIQRENMKEKREDLNEMDPRKFEFLVADFFRTLDYKIQFSPSQ